MPSRPVSSLTISSANSCAIRRASGNAVILKPANQTPLIALNELNGASTTTPWTTTNSQYRNNVLELMRQLSSRGARPFLLVNSAPYTGAEAAARQTGVKLGDEQFARAPRRPRSGPVILSVARMYPRKRLSDLLRATAILTARIPEARTRVVGQGPEWAQLVRLRGELGAADTVELLGDVSRERLAEEYVNADLFCLPSVQEGFGIVFLEAMAAGLPVVACRAAAIPEVVRDGLTGVLVPPRDPKGLADVLEQLARDPGRARRLGDEGRRRVAEFAPERVAERFLHAVRSIVGCAKREA